MEKILSSSTTCYINDDSAELIEFSDIFTFADLKEAFEAHFGMPVEKAVFETEGYSESGSLRVYSEISLPQDKREYLESQREK